MAIPERYFDHRATNVSRRLCDIVLERLSHERGEEPERIKQRGVLFYRIGDDVVQLRCFAGSKNGEVWTNISRQHLEKVKACSANYLGIAYSEEKRSEVVLYHLSPQLLERVLNESGHPTTQAGVWSLRVERSGPSGLAFARSGKDALTISGGDLDRHDCWTLSDTELSAIEGIDDEVEMGVNAGDSENIPDMQSALINVSDAYDLLLDSIDEAWEEGRRELERILAVTRSRLGQAIADTARLVDHIEEFRIDAKRGHDQWETEFLPDTVCREKLETAQALEKSEAAFSRTNWTVKKDMVHFQTQRPGEGEPYSYRFPCFVAQRIVDAIMDKAAVGPFTTSEVLQNVRTFVTGNSNFEKSPRTPVLCIINAGLKDGVLTYQEGSTRRYRVAPNKSVADISRWAQFLGNPRQL